MSRRCATRTQSNDAIGPSPQGCQDETGSCIRLESVGSHLPLPMESSDGQLHREEIANRVTSTASTPGKLRLPRSHAALVAPRSWPGRFKESRHA